MKSRQIETGAQQFLFFLWDNWDNGNYYILLLKLKCETGRVAKSGFITD